MILKNITINETTKKCIICNEYLSLDKFNDKKSNKDGYDNRCKLCRKKHDKITRQLKKYAYPKPELCEACGIPHKKGLCLDHNHITETFRGWLCEDCNLILGKIKDNPLNIIKLSQYLLTRDNYSDDLVDIGKNFIKMLESKNNI